MKAYQEYKDSGIKWVGKLPSHWTVMPIKYAVIVNREALTEQIEDDFELQYIDIGNVNERGIINPPERMKFVDAPSRARRVIKKNDTIISTVRTYLKAVAFIESDDKNLIASTGFATLTSLGNTYPKYLYYLVSSQGFVDTVSANSTGVSYPAITSTELAQITAWLPPLPEQQAIAEFLDRKTAQIDALIAKKQRQIELLHEMRTALINHAVTKGLNPNVKMKDSGVEWLGEIPNHWNCSKIKHLTDVVSKGTTPTTIGAEFTDTGIRFVKAENIFDGIVNDIPASFINEETNALLRRSILQANDVLIVIAGATTGKVGIIEQKQLPANTNQAVAFIRLNDQRLARFIFYWLSSSPIQNYVWLQAVQSAQPNLSLGNISNFPVPLPPIEEAMNIVADLDRSLARINTLTQKVNQEIELFKEYRTALISEAVTGKIDVRKAE